MDNLREDSDADELWAQEEGVPTFREPFIQKYLDGRDALITQEKRRRSDYPFQETLSPMAAQASAIVAGIRFEEQQTLWNAEYEDNLAKQEDIEVHPGMMFSLAKKRMEASKLWRIVKRMPKGALLHCHLEAMGDAEWLIDEALATDGICILSECPLASREARENAPFHFKYVKGVPNNKTASIWTESYHAHQTILINDAADSFPGGRNSFREWFVSRVTITHDESLKHHIGPSAVWRKFTSCFGILASLQHYEPIFKKFVRRMLLQLFEDGVRWVDIRSVFIVPFVREGADRPDEHFEYMLDVLQREIDSFCASAEGTSFWGARLIWTTMRHLGHRGIVESMQECIAMKQRFPNLICGFDLVGQEDLGRPLVDLVPELFWFKKRCVEEGVDIPFYFHAGETLGDGDTADENLFDAVLLGSRRIGHGFSLYKHPLLIDMIKDKKILIESCPVSNEILRLTGSIMSHPLPALLSRGVPCTLSNDGRRNLKLPGDEVLTENVRVDPAILGQGHSGMTHDFWQALQGWENLGLGGLASLAENSVRYASFDDCSAKQWAEEIRQGSFGSGARSRRMKEWAADFEKFCQWIVLEFGDSGEIDGLD